MFKLCRDDCSLLVGDVFIKLSAVVRDLDVLLDAELTMKQHVDDVVSSCFFQLRRIRRLQRASTQQPCSWSVVWCCPD